MLCPGWLKQTKAHSAPQCVFPTIRVSRYMNSWKTSNQKYDTCDTEPHQESPTGSSWHRSNELQSNRYSK